MFMIGRTKVPTESWEIHSSHDTLHNALEKLIWSHLAADLFSQCVCVYCGQFVRKTGA